MFVVKNVFCILFIKLFIVTCRAGSDYFAEQSSTVENDIEYLDPHSFYYDKHTQTEILPAHNDKVRKNIGGDNDDGQCDFSCAKELDMCRISLRNRPTNTDIADEILSRRFVNMLLSRTKFKQEGKLHTGFIELEATNAEMEALKKFGEGKLGLREVDAVLNKVMRTPEYDRFYQSAIWVRYFTQWIWSSLSYLARCIMDYKEIVASIIFTLCAVHFLKRMRYNLWVVLSFGIGIIFVISFFITWWKLIQDAEIKHTSKQMQNMKMPIHCQPHLMTWWDKLTSLFSKDDCEKYYESIMKTPFLEVTPAMALSHMLSHALYEPLQLAGKAFAQFLKNLTAEMSWLESALVHIIICLTFVPMLICSLVLLAGGSLNLGGFGPLSFFSIRGPSRSSARPEKSLESKLERRPIEINVQSHGAGMIESTRSEESDKLALAYNPGNEKSKNEKRTKRKKIESRPKENQNESRGAEKVTISADGSGDYKITDGTSGSDNDKSEFDDESAVDTDVENTKPRVRENSDKSK